MGAPDGELALVVLQNAHDPEGVLAHVVDALQEAAHLRHRPGRRVQPHTQLRSRPLNV